MVNLESQQVQWARQCCKHGNCPICNPQEEDEGDYPYWKEDQDMEDYYDRKEK